MGHTRLGKIPTSKKWREVVELLARDISSSDGLSIADRIAEIASKTLEAAEVGLQKSTEDKGLRFTFFMLTQLVLAARQENWLDKLKASGIELPANAGLFDLTTGFQNCIDQYISKHTQHTDISEIAQLAACEAITQLISPRSQSLFGSGPEELKEATRELSTKKGFSNLGQQFFAKFMARYLNFYLSRATAGQTGKNGIRDIGELAEFNEALSTHCRQSAQIVHAFCGEWYSKTEFKEKISLANTNGFMAVAIRKLQAEMNRQGAEK